MKNFNKLSALSVAIATALLSSTVMAQTADEDSIEEVVTTATRLQGTATAVIEERKEQAFVADILGAEQISRTGDSDAASALRRVTGLTLVDGKFIYVRGLGERYSSARLNGAAVPSPDLSRNVIPLDIFPANIIESLSVQKAYSPNIQAGFGGGYIDIRTKSIPNEFIGFVELGVGDRLTSADDLSYQRNEAGVAPELRTAIGNLRGDFSISNIITRQSLTDGDTTAAQQATEYNKSLMKTLYRDLAVSEESADIDWSGKFAIGNSFDEDVFGGKIGAIFSASYDKSSTSADKRTAVLSDGAVAGCSTEINSQEELANTCFDSFRDITSTTVNERFNSYFSVGYEYDTHSISYTNIYLSDDEDEVELSIVQAPNASSIFTIFGDGQADKEHNFFYEERELTVHQFIGQHTLLDFWGIGFDWQYTESEATTFIPGNAEFNFRNNYDSNGVLVDTVITGDDNRVIFSYTDMDDNVKSYSGNFSLPISGESYDLELKAGYDFTERGRYYTTDGFSIDNVGGTATIVNSTGSNTLGDSGFLTDQFIDNNFVAINFNEPLAPNADDYIAAQRVEAGYGLFDLIWDNVYRISGGLRWEQFSQTAIATSSLIFTQQDLDIFYDPETIEAGSINDDDVFGSLAFTYLQDDYQIRASFGQSVVRPDFREVVPVFYFDPLTDIRTFGNPNLVTSNIDHFDLRYEYYGSTGNNYSVALFHKEISDPIESRLRRSDEDYNSQFINGQEATVTGIEAEFLRDLSEVFNGLFISGNLTLSDSEVTIDPARAGAVTNTTRRMAGHSEYVVNFQLNYDSMNGEHAASLVYNVFGDRILASGLGGNPDVFEQPFHSLDFVYSYYPDFSTTISLKIKNILGEDQEVTQADVAVREREIPTGISLSYQYNF